MKHFKGKGLTLWRPWDVAVVFYGKSFENRNWNPNYIGPVAIHSGQYFDRNSSIELFPKIVGIEKAHQIVKKARKTAGNIIGICYLDFCFKYDEYNFLKNNPWCFGPYCWSLLDIKPIKPIPMKGHQGLWNAEFDYEELLK